MDFKGVTSPVAPFFVRNLPKSSNWLNICTNVTRQSHPWRQTIAIFQAYILYIVCLIIPIFFVYLCS